MLIILGVIMPRPIRMRAHMREVPVSINGSLISVTSTTCYYYTQLPPSGRDENYTISNGEKTEKYSITWGMKYRRFNWKQREKYNATYSMLLLT
jgi:hypothetical protein